MPRWFLVDRSFNDSEGHDVYLKRRRHRRDDPCKLDERGNLRIVRGIVAYNHLKNGEPVATYVPGFYRSGHMETRGTKRPTEFRVIEVVPVYTEDQEKATKILKRAGYKEPIHFSL